MNTPGQILPLPPQGDIETKRILKQVVVASRFLGEMEKASAKIPNPEILNSTLFLREAHASYEIENIVTTTDELYRSSIAQPSMLSASIKEIRRYIPALHYGYEQVRKNELLTRNCIIGIQRNLSGSRAGIRSTPGTVLKNPSSDRIIYTPPQEYAVIDALLTNLEKFINDDTLSDFDPLVKLALIHHQFESIHPFHDYNGRTGRIVSVLYLVAKGILTQPILYLSRYIAQTKGEYYRLLQDTRKTGDWEPWVLYTLDGIAETAKQVAFTVRQVAELMFEYKQRLRGELPKIYSQDLLNSLFKHPYTKTEFIKNELNVSSQTARLRLEKLTQAGLVSKQKLGRDLYFVNRPLLDLLS